MFERTREYCDLVMKGGITSGVVYPPAVLELVKCYDLRSIGGTSAGAIAAAASAAAALGKRRKDIDPGSVQFPPDEVGFEGLEKAAEQLKQPRFIFRLFQPAPGGTAAFRLLVRLGPMPGVWPSLRALFWVVVQVGFWPGLAGLAAAVALGWLVAGPLGALGAVAPGFVTAFLVGALYALWRIASGLRLNRFGLCPGLIQRGHDQPALTDWLHDQLQRLSGQQEPLLFKDLWDAPLYDDERKQVEEHPSGALFEKVVALQLMTTDLTHREPRTLPFEKSCFWFDRDDFDRLFPKQVVDWMASRPGAALKVGDRTWYRLPQGDQLPVLVATRMSLSFPILLSAIPLHEEKPGKPGPTNRSDMFETGAGRRRSLMQVTDALAMGGAPCTVRLEELRPCWFSDGGIGSNFPIHLFDAPLPLWPTFAINLVSPAVTDGSEDKVILAQDTGSPWQPPFESYVPIPSSSALGEVASFLLAIIDTMHNWRDLLLSRAPGHRDRIVHVPLVREEGGLNLDMSADVLRRVVCKGRQAGEKLRTEFRFDRHWWIRWRSVAATAQEFMISFGTTAAAEPTESYASAHSAASTGEPHPEHYRFNQAQSVVATARFATMKKLGADWRPEKQDSLVCGAPEPQGQLRIVPTF